MDILAEINRVMELESRALFTCRMLSDYDNL